MSDVNVSEAQLMVDPYLSSNASAIFASSGLLNSTQSSMHNSSVGGRSFVFSEVSALIDDNEHNADVNRAGGVRIFDGDQEGIDMLESLFESMDPAAVAAAGAESNVLAVSLKLPVHMRRSVWSLEDFQLQKQLHKGYASEVYKVGVRVKSCTWVYLVLLLKVG